MLLSLLLWSANGRGVAAESGPGESTRPPRLRAGVSQTEITPPIGAPLLGALVASTGVHDPLFARALVIGDGGERAAIVCLDLVGMDLALAREIRALWGTGEEK